MNANICLVLTLGVALLSTWDSSAAPADTNHFSLIVSLQDGSRLVGMAGDENYLFRSDVLGDIKLPMGKIRLVEFQPKTNLVRLTTTSGDALTVQMATKDVRVGTAFGTVKLPANLLKQIRVLAPGKSPVRVGLVAHWSGEGDGGDSAGGNNATLTDVSFAAGKVGEAFVLNGETSQITVPPSEKLAVSNLTFEGWIFPAELNRPEPIIEYGGSGQDVGISIWLNTRGGSSFAPGALYAGVRDQSRAGFNFIEVKSASGIAPPGRWTHVAFTFDTATRIGSLYCNGVQVGTASSPKPVAPLGFLQVNLGCRDERSNDIMQGARFSGLLDEIGIYNRALSAEEIKSIATEENFGEPLSPPTPQRPQLSNGYFPQGFN